MGRLTPCQPLPSTIPITAGIPAWLRRQIHLGCTAETWLRSQHQPLGTQEGGRGCHSCRKQGAPPGSCLPPSRCGAIPGGSRHRHPGAEGHPGRACGSRKAEGRVRPCKGGVGAAPHRAPPPRESGHRGVQAGPYRPPCGQGGVRAEQGLAPAAGEITPRI